MGPSILSRVLEACQMSNEAPADDEVAARVRAAVAGDFKSEHVNGFPMRPDPGKSLFHLCLPFLVFFDLL